MKKVFLGIFIIAVLALAYYMISPLFINKTVDEKIEDLITVPIETSDETPLPTPITLGQGTFEGRANHRVEGSVSVFELEGKTYIRFEEDFDAINGPDLFVHLGNNDTYDENARIAKLKGNIGGQNYEIPEELSLDGYSEVWIWCRTFSVPFGVANITKE